MSDTKYQLQTPVVEGEVVDSSKVGGVKQGHKCCGVCCDTRRAVIIVNLVNIGLTAIALFGIAFAKANVENIQNNADQIDDDELMATLEGFNDLPLGTIIAVAILRIAASACGVAGAYFYNIWLVGISALAYVLEFIFSLIGLQIDGAVIAALFAYPHYFFIQEVRKGIMSKENYPNEEHSCCCV